MISSSDFVLLGAIAVTAFVGARAGSRGRSDAAQAARLEQKIDLVLSQLGTESPVSPSSPPSIPMAVPLAPTMTDSVVDQIRRGRKIEAIKLYREQHPGTGLKEAKEAVDQMERLLQ